MVDQNRHYLADLERGVVVLAHQVGDVVMEQPEFARRPIELNLVMDD